MYPQQKKMISVSQGAHAECSQILLYIKNDKENNYENIKLFIKNKKNDTYEEYTNQPLNNEEIDQQLLLAHKLKSIEWSQDSTNV